MKDTSYVPVDAEKLKLACKLTIKGLEAERENLLDAHSEWIVVRSARRGRFARWLLNLPTPRITTKEDAREWMSKRGSARFDNGSRDDELSFDNFDYPIKLLLELSRMGDVGSVVYLSQKDFLKIADVLETL